MLSDKEDKSRKLNAQMMSTLLHYRDYELQTYTSTPRLCLFHSSKRTTLFFLEYV